MQDLKKIKLFTMDKDMASVIGQNSKENIYSFLKRMDIYVEEQWDKDVLALLLKDTVLENPEYLLYVHGKEALSFMVELWESDEIELSQTEWSLVGQLKLLGLIDCPQPFFQDGSIDTIHIVKEAKDAFYFYIKSKTAKRLMDKYENWESIIRGLMSYYGIISFQRFYFFFCKTCREPVDDAVFRLFLSVRINLLSYGGFAFERYSQTEYYQNYDVSFPENILDFIVDNKKLDYYLPGYDALLLVGNNNGLGDWEGVSELAEVLIDDLELEYYRTVVVVKTCILNLQNGGSFEDTMQQFLVWCPEIASKETKIRKAVKMLYQTVPVYSLKGWSRRDLRKASKISPSLTMIKGGKQDNKERR